MNTLDTSYFVFLNATLGARQAHNTSVHLIFPALFTKNIVTPVILLFVDLNNCLRVRIYADNSLCKLA